MKKIILSLAIAISGYGSYAQVNDTGTKVGIGTAAPETLLDVNGTFTSGTYSPNVNAFQPVAFYRYNGITGVSYPGQFRWYASPNNSLYKYAALYQLRAWDVGSNNENTIVTFRGDGMIGIGTESPASALDVGGLLQLSSISSSTPPAGLSYGLFPYGGVGLGIFSGATGANQGIGLWTNPNGIKTEVMRILSGGNIGIGTTQPDQKLTVIGTIHSSEVKVDNNMPPPDYVFEKTYKPIDLTTLKVYLDKNHHLPEIPSAAEMIKNGLNLGEMNLRLLKKVEELTLYIIDKDKQLTEQNIKLSDEQQSIKSQQAQIDELKAQLKAIVKSLPQN